MNLEAALYFTSSITVDFGLTMFASILQDLFVNQLFEAPYHVCIIFRNSYVKWFTVPVSY
jgi:hypothetical protein